MLVHWIWFSLCKAVTIRQKTELLQRFRDPEEIYLGDEKAYMQIEGITEKAVNSLMDKDLSSARQILERCVEKNISILTYGDGAYPKRLKNIETPPLVLYYKGVLPDWQEVPVIGIVGTRKASAAGLRNAAVLSHEIAECGGLVVSGGAEGVDTAALQGALQAGKKVIAVLGFGADIVYPAKNKQLFAEIERQGCLVTEFVPGTPPNSWNFPMRNRIISGLSVGVLIVEAPERSGAMNTARHAQDQGRDLFVVPGNIGQSCCAGSNSLLKERAIPISSGWELMEEYAPIYPCVKQHKAGNWEPEEMVDDPSCSERKTERPRRKSDKIAIDNREESKYSVLENRVAQFTEEEQQVLSQLSEAPVLVDKLLDALELPSGKAQSILTMLALKGVVQNHPGNRVSLRK